MPGESLCIGKPQYRKVVEALSYIRRPERVEGHCARRIFVYWETQYRKVVEALSYIRRPDTGQQAEGLSCFVPGEPNTNESE